jgi:hypothetical protein
MAVEEQNGRPDLSTGWLGSKVEVATGLIETLIVPAAGPKKKRLNPSLRAYSGKFLEAVSGGVRALSGSRLWLLNKENRVASSLAQEGNSLTSDVNGHVEFDMVQGTRIRVNFITTRVSRDLDVPQQPSANVLTLIGNKKDAFAVVKAG